MKLNYHSLDLMAKGILPTPIGETINIRTSDDADLMERKLTKLGIETMDGKKVLVWRWEKQATTPEGGMDCGYSGVTVEGLHRSKQDAGRPYFLRLDNEKTALVVMPKGCGAVYYDTVRDEFARQFAPQTKEPWSQYWPIHSHDRVGAVQYHWELAGPDGASFMLYAIRNHTDKDTLKKAETYLRDRQDVVRMQSIHMELVEFDQPQLDNAKVEE